MELSVVGKRIERVDGSEKVTGQALYLDDLKMAEMLYGKVLRSAFPHAKIVNIDTGRAKRLLGVKVVVTGKDLPYTYGPAVKDQPFYAIGKVRHLGEAVAGVAAIDRDVAEEALSLIRVEYEELPALFDPLEAVKPDALLIHEDLGQYWHADPFRPVAGTNICNHFKLRKGDIERGFHEADQIFEDTFTNQMVNHCCLETHGAVAQVNASGKVTMWAGAQSPFTSRQELASALGIPITKIRFINSWVGGGFGGKHGLKAEPLAVGLAMHAKGRPVKVVLTREEVFTSTVSRKPCTIWMKTGVKRDGRLIAREIKLYWDTGAYAEVGPWVCRNAGYASAGPYVIPHISVDSYCIYTNNPIGSGFRGFGVPQVTWAHESQMDIIAEALGIDPLEMRLINAVEEGSLSATGEILHSVGVKETLRKAAELCEWKKPLAKNRGRGIACMNKNTSAPTSSSAVVRINEDGSVTVMTGAVDMGQGVQTIAAQIVSEELSIPIERIQVLNPDTDMTPYDRSTSSSRATFHTGNAIRAAAIDARNQIFEMVSQSMEANPSDLVLKEGRIFVAGSPSKSVAISDVVKGGAYMTKAGKPVVGRGVFSTSSTFIPLDPETGQSAKPTAFWMYASQAAEVEVDTETGKVEVLKMTAAHDVGKAINPLLCEQQIEGSLVMGIGMTLYEEQVVYEGKTLNPNFHDYKLPTSLDVPSLVPCVVEAAHESGPYGAKGLGEPGLAPSAAAISNAIYDAIGVRVTDLPITPEKILKALGKL